MLYCSRYCTCDTMLIRKIIHYSRLNYRNHCLVRNKAYINGNWVCAKSGELFPVYDPGSGDEIADIPNMDTLDAKVAIQAAYNAFKYWSTFTPDRRSKILRAWHELIKESAGTLAELLTIESGKVLKEAKHEIEYGNSFIDWFAEEGRRTHGEVLTSSVKHKELLVIKEPIGVVAIITPWNFPFAMLTRKASAALAAGCTCVVKPSENTPFTALILGELAEKAGMPEGVFNVITSDRTNAPKLGKELCENHLVAGVSFTGSTVVGQWLYQQCSLGIKRLKLELGGNAPFIVFNDADIDDAIAGAMTAKFRNAGQACIGVNRFLIQDTVFSEFIGKFKSSIATLKLGYGLKPNVDIGPLIDKTHLKKITSLVNDARNKGAHVLQGGKPANRVGDLFYHPTLLTNITPEMNVYCDEIFGPIAICIKFSCEEEAIRISNSTRSGLAGYFYTNDMSQIWRVMKKLELGMVGVNTGYISNTVAPFGGVKESGIGREGSHYGIREFINLKYICIGNLE